MHGRKPRALPSAKHGLDHVVDVVRCVRCMRRAPVLVCRWLDEAALAPWHDAREHRGRTSWVGVRGGRATRQESAVGQCGETKYAKSYYHQDVLSTRSCSTNSSQSLVSLVIEAFQFPPVAMTLDSTSTQTAKRNRLTPTAHATRMPPSARPAQRRHRHSRGSALTAPTKLLALSLLLQTASAQSALYARLPSDCSLRTYSS